MFMHLLYVIILLLLEMASATPVTHHGVAETRDIRRDIRTSIISRTTQNVVIWQVCAALCTDGQSLSIYYDTAEQRCYCNSDADSDDHYDATAPQVVYGVFERNVRTSTIESHPRYEAVPYRQDCLELYEDGFTIDGVYKIRPEGGTAVDTWCDMGDGGWTVIQRRMNGEVSFDREWNDYKTGFGKLTEEYWLGLETVHLLTRQSSKLSVELYTFGDRDPDSALSTYQNFSVSDESDGYRLNVVDLTKTCGNPMNYRESRLSANNKKFTTSDRDNDSNGNGNCATEYEAGWWYGRCFRCNLNGIYIHGGGRIANNAHGIIHAECWGYKYSLRKTVMKMKRG